MRKSLLTVFLILLAAAQLAAAPRPEQEARQLAETFFKEACAVQKRNGVQLTLTATSDVLRTTDKRSATNDAAWYAYNNAAGGFVIVSGDDRMPDILGYSLDNPFATTGMPDNLRAVLTAYADLADRPETEKTTGTVYQAASASTYPESIAPLLGDISFGQGEPYNNLCPTIDGEHCLTGCVATTMASIATYYKYPTKGTGIRQYSSETNGLHCSFDYDNTTFDWDNILHTYAEGDYNDAQANAVANLMLACGVASQMDYSLVFSGAYDIDALTGMAENMGYNPYMLNQRRAMYSSTEWMNIIKGQLSAGQPLYYSGSDPQRGGHAFVLDGYDSDDRVHINWGWNGMSNGYFDILTLDPYGEAAEDGTASGFFMVQSMISGIAPADRQGEPTSLFSCAELQLDPDRQMAYAYGIYNCGYTFNGQLALVAEKDGVQTQISIPTQMQLAPNYGYDMYYQRYSLSPLGAGTYTVYWASRANGEERWSRARGTLSQTAACILQMKENKEYTIYYPNGNDVKPEAVVSLKGKAYRNSPATFEVAVTNPNDEEFYGCITVGLVRLGETKILAMSNAGQVLLQPGTDTTLVASLTLNTTETTLEAVPLWYTAENERYSIGDPLTFDIAEAAAVSATEAGGPAVPVCCSAPGDPDIRFRYTDDVERTELYDASGQLLLSTRPDSDGNGTYTVRAADCGKGICILRIHTTGGKTATLKIQR